MKVGCSTRRRAPKRGDGAPGAIRARGPRYARRVWPRPTRTDTAHPSAPKFKAHLPVSVTDSYFGEFPAILAEHDQLLEHPAHVPIIWAPRAWRFLQVRIPALERWPAVVLRVRGAAAPVCTRICAMSLQHLRTTPMPRYKEAEHRHIVVAALPVLGMSSSRLAVWPWWQRGRAGSSSSSSACGPVSRLSPRDPPRHPLWRGRRDSAKPGVKRCATLEVLGIVGGSQAVMNMPKPLMRIIVAWATSGASIAVANESFASGWARHRGANSTLAAAATYPSMRECNMLCVCATWSTRHRFIYEMRWVWIGRANLQQRH